MKLLFALLSSFFLVFEPLAAMAKASFPSVRQTEEAIGVRTIQYFDTNRSRPVTVEVWYPTEKGSLGLLEPEDAVWIHPPEVRNAHMAPGKDRYPLILMSHGHRGDRRERTWLADSLVKKGYIVASVEHYGNTWNHYKPLLSLRFWERAKDVSFALTQILEEPLFRDHLDAERIGFIGYSLGGMTGLALAGAEARDIRNTLLKQDLGKGLKAKILQQIDFSEGEKNYRDPRIRSMVLLFPAAVVYPLESLKKVNIPIGLVAALHDEVLPHKDHAARLIEGLVPRKLKLMGESVSHYSLLNLTTKDGKKRLKKAFSEEMKHTQAFIQKEVGQFAVEFFDENL